MAQHTLKMEWDAHEYEHKERSSDWFWAVSISAVSIAIASIIFGNIIFGILVIVGAFALSLFANRPPETVHVVVDEKGITKGKVLYPYAALESYWIDIEHPHNKILLKSQKPFMPLITIPLSKDADVEDLHETLSTVLPEEFHSLPFLEKILEYLGF